MIPCDGRYIHSWAPAEALEMQHPKKEKPPMVEILFGDPERVCTTVRKPAMYVPCPCGLVLWRMPPEPGGMAHA